MKTNLINGNRYLYDNENYCYQHNIDDLRGAECFYVPGSNWQSGFKIVFNGKLIHSSKTFKSFENRLNQLIVKWHLELKEIN